MRGGRWHGRAPGPYSHRPEGWPRLEGTTVRQLEPESHIPRTRRRSRRHRLALGVVPPALAAGFVVAGARRGSADTGRPNLFPLSIPVSPSPLPVPLPPTPAPELPVPLPSGTPAVPPLPVPAPVVSVD